VTEDDDARPGADFDRVGLRGDDHFAAARSMLCDTIVRSGDQSVLGFLYIRGK
jgi:hypothetical protein